MPSLSRGFPIRALIPQTANQRANFFLALTDRLLQALTALLLALRGLLLLLLPALQQLLVQQLRACQECCSVFCRGLLALPLLLQATDHTVHLTITPWGQQLLGLVKHIRIEPKARRDCQCIAASWNSPQQFIGGGQGLRIESNRGILKTSVVVFEGLEFTEVGGGNREPSPIRKSLEQSRGQGRSLAGIRSSTHLIQQHQGWRTTALQRLKNAPDALHMTTEGGQALLEGLLISDVRQHLGTPGQGRLPRTGQKHAGACHQCSEANAFQGDRFATGVRPGDRHHPQPRRHLHRDGNHGWAIRTLVLPHQWWVSQT